MGEWNTTDVAPGFIPEVVGQPVEQDAVALFERRPHRDLVDGEGLDRGRPAPASAMTKAAATITTISRIVPRMVDFFSRPPPPGSPLAPTAFGPVSPVPVLPAGPIPRS